MRAHCSALIQNLTKKSVKVNDEEWGGGKQCGVMLWSSIYRGVEFNVESDGVGIQCGEGWKN